MATAAIVAVMAVVVAATAAIVTVMAFVAVLAFAIVVAVVAATRPGLVGAPRRRTRRKGDVPPYLPGRPLLVQAAAGRIAIGPRRAGDAPRAPRGCHISDDAPRARGTSGHAP